MSGEFPTYLTLITFISITVSGNKGKVSKEQLLGGTAWVTSVQQKVLSTKNCFDALGLI